MKSKSNPKPEGTPLYSFYRPHSRAATWVTGDLVNHVTGEVYKPVARTKQSFVAECDINNILKQYRLTGQIRHISSKAAQGSYDDLPAAIDFQDAMNMVIAAEQSFATLPSKVRDRFGNDPSNFLAFMADPSNQDEIIKLGLATRRPGPAQEPLAERPASPPPPKEPSSTGS